MIKLFISVLIVGAFGIAATFSNNVLILGLGIYICLMALEKGRWQ